MSLSGLSDQSRTPSPDDVSAVLGPSVDRWYRLIEAIGENHPPVDQVWNYGGATIGWTLRLKRNDRVIVYLIPQHGVFLAGLVLGERAIQNAESLQIPDHVRALLDAAPRYAEGRGFRVPVHSDDDLTAVVQLAAAKMATTR